jgi:hypothetical protein
MYVCVCVYVCVCGYEYVYACVCVCVSAYESMRYLHPSGSALRAFRVVCCLALLLLWGLLVCLSFPGGCLYHCVGVGLSVMCVCCSMCTYVGVRVERARWVKCWIPFETVSFWAVLIGTKVSPKGIAARQESNTSQTDCEVGWSHL